jgi:hypothetical protein
MKTISTLFLIATLFVHISPRILSEGGTIWSGNSLLSDDGVFTLVVQSDGNVVIYGCKAFTATWATNTSGTNQRVLAMQGDGNLVLYDNWVAKWASNSGGKGKGPYYLNMQTDGNLVIYGSTGAIWASNTGNQGLCQICAYFHDSTNAGTSNQIKLAYYDFSSNYYTECYLNGTKNKATGYCCTPTTATIDRATSFDVAHGTRYVKIQIYGNDMATIGGLSVFGKQLDNFYNYDMNFYGGEGQIFTFNTDARGYTYFDISTGDWIHPIVVIDIDHYYTRSGHVCYFTYSYDS